MLVRKHSVPSLKYVNQGFTLIELIVGIVIFAVAMVSVISFLQPQVKQGIDPIWQVRAITLGQSLSNEILAKSFDHNSNQVGGLQRCNEVVACTNSANLGPETGETRRLYNDVDDYNGLDLADFNILNSIEVSSAVNGISIYSGFRAQVSVFYDQNSDGVNDDDVNQDGNLDSGTLVANKKLVTITITTPGGDTITVAGVKGNF